MSKSQQAMRTVYVCDSCHSPDVKGSVGRVLADSESMEIVAKGFDEKTYGGCMVAKSHCQSDHTERS